MIPSGAGSPTASAIAPENPPRSNTIIN